MCECSWSPNNPQSIQPPFPPIDKTLIKAPFRRSANGKKERKRKPFFPVDNGVVGEKMPLRGPRREP